MALENQPSAWYVLRTQVKKERAASAFLMRDPEVEVFFPKLRYLKTTRRGKIWWVEPLFPGYLLAKFNRITHGRAVTHAQGVSKIVSFGKHVPEVPDSFVETLRDEVAKYDQNDGEITVGWKVEKGQEVEIAEGPFRGIQGEVLEVRPSVERVSLLLEFLGEQKPIEIDLQDLILANPDLPEGLQGE